MYLETNQARHNTNKVALSRFSASGDPQQTPHDVNAELIKSAEFQAAGRTLGMSPEETLAMVSRQQRRQQRKGDGFDSKQYLRQIAQASKTTTNEVGRAELDSLKFEEDDELAAAFGQMQDDEQTYRADDRGFTVDEETGLLRRETLDEQKPIEMGEFTSIGTRRNSKTGKLFPAKRKVEEALGYEGANASKSAMSNALRDLESSAARQKSGVGGSIARVFGGSAVDSETSTAIDALKQYFQNEKQADARVGRAIVRQDNRRFDPEVRKANQFRADAEAQNIARTDFLTGGAGAFADEAIGRIGEMRRMGAAGALGPMEQSLVIRQDSPGTYPQAEAIVDGTGRVVGYADPNTKVPIALDPELGISLATQGANTPDTAQLINAPQNPQTAREWAASNLPAMTQDTGSTPPRYPQANISKETTDFSNRVRNVLASLKLPNAPTVSDNVRNIDEIEGVAKFIQKELEKRGDTLMIRNPDETSRTKNIPAGTQVVSGLMQKLGMTSGDEERLANAMFQLDAAKRSSVNQNPTGTYLSRTGEPTKDVIFNAPPEGFGSMPIAQQGGGTSIRVGTDAKGKPIKQDIRSAMAGLDAQRGGAAAQKPFIGMPADRPTQSTVRGPMDATLLQEPVYNRTGQTDPAAIRSTLEALSEKRAKKGESKADAAIRRKRNEANIIGAQAVQRRADEDLARRADAMSTIIGSLPPVARRSSFPRSR